MKVLIVEDELDLAQGMVAYLSGLGFLCEIAGTYGLAVEKVEAFEYDCILLDLMLPDGDGLRLLELLKDRRRQDGIIVISAKGSIEDKVRGLNIGADDYLAKPFHLSELNARILSVIRRRRFDNANVVVANEVEIDLLARAVSVSGNPVALTRKEFDLLLYFVGNRNRVVSRSALAEHLSGDMAEMLDNHDFVYAHVKNLKRKLMEAGCPTYLRTVYGTGYKWETKGNS